MSTIKNIELIDDVRTDALILMKNDPSLTYDQAYIQAKQKLIGDENINSFEFKPFEVELDSSLVNETPKTEETGNEPVEEKVETKEEAIATLDENIIPTDDMSEEEVKDAEEVLKQLEGLDTDYYGSIRNQLSGIIDVSKFNDDQIEQLYVGHKMGVDITKIFNNKLTSQQIKFLCVLLATGKDITNFVIDPNFDVDEAFEEIIQ
jgi:hypothetical protein